MKLLGSPWMFVAPALVVIGVFFLLPVIAALALSFTDFDLYALANMKNLRLIAFDNYIEVLRTPLFWKSLINTLYFVVVGVPLSIAASLGAASLLNSPLAKLKGIFRTALFAPVVTTIVAVALIWRYMFNTRYGLINDALIHLGFSPIDWLGDPHWSMPAIILFAVWKNFGYNMIILLAGLQAIPQDLYEAARIDGASVWAQFRHITLPSLRPVLLLVSIITVAGYFQLFAEPYELPTHYLPREADLAGLKQKLLAGGANVGITGQSSTLGVQGMGGIGKTVLAAALAHDSEVRQAFPDGIYWLTIGQKPNLLDLQNQLLRQLTGSKETLTTEQEAKDALREALEGRQALVVVDDAWTIDDADAFSVSAPPARLLITTRNNEVLVGLGAEEHRVDVLSPSDALKMLAEWVGQKSPDKLPPEAAEVAKECGYLPLALAMIGAMVRCVGTHARGRTLSLASPRGPWSDQDEPFPTIRIPTYFVLSRSASKRWRRLTVSDTSIWRCFPKISPSPKERCACCGTWTR